MTDPRAELLDHLLPLVPFDGWSGHALAQAAIRAGLTQQAAQRAFPRPIDCIRYFFLREDHALADAFAPEELAQMRVPDRISTLVTHKLKHLSVHKEAVRRAIAALALPWNIPTALQLSYDAVDNIWRLAGDKSTDFNFYTKRTTLAAVYSGTVLFWLNDNSEDMASTRDFLKRRLSDVAAFGKKTQEIKSKLRMA